MKLYKYLNVAGATATVQNGTLLFTAPKFLNDPFDISIKTLFAYDEFDLKLLTDSFLDFLFSDEKFPEGNGSEIANSFLACRSVVVNQPTTYKEQLRSKLYLAPPWDLQSLLLSGRKNLKIVSEAFEKTGVFCASSTFDSYLMWAHYAEQHYGVVLEFTPNLEQDSILRLAEPVAYSPVRPILYPSMRDFLVNAMFRDTHEVVKKFYKEITMTKSLDWVYERELRTVIPLDKGLPHERGVLHRYHDDELTGVYLGCRTTTQSRLNIVDWAQRRNPDLAVYEMIPEDHTYELRTRAL